MSTRQEFSVAPNRWLILVALLVLAVLFAASIWAVSVPINVVDDRTAAERGLLRAFGWGGIPVFGAAALFIASVLAKVMKKRRWTALVLDEQSFIYSGLKVPWTLVRDTFIHKQLGRSYLAVRTISDRAIAHKIDEILGKRIPYMLLFELHFRQWRSQCAILIPRMEGFTVPELQRIVEEYRRAAGPPETKSTTHE